MFDLLLRNGLLVDGSGAEPVRADVAVADGVIKQVGPLPEAEAAETVDATGLVVTPGFIDIHRHADAAVFRDRFGEIELRQGITTIVNGNCGLSIAPCPPERQREVYDFLAPVVGKVPASNAYDTFGHYLDAVAAVPLPLNFGCCVGDGTVRMAVRGFSPGKLSPDEVAAVRARLAEAIDAGALGVTLGLVYAPETYYDADALVEVLEPMRGRGATLTTHIRGEGDLLHSSLREVIDVAKRLAIPLHVSHFKAVGRQNWGAGLREGMRIMDQARADGLDVTCDVYPYVAGSSQMIQLLPPSYLEGGIPRIVERLRDPESRSALVEIMTQPQKSYENLFYSIGWSAVLVTTVNLAKNQQYVGKTVEEIAALQGKNPFDCAFDLLAEENCAVSMVAFLMDEADVLDAIRYPHSSIISDSVYPSGGLPHPRLYGSFPKVLGEFVHKRKELSLAEAVRKMTSQPAAVYRLAKKGLVAPGYDADLCVFDLGKIGSAATYHDPKQLGTGFARVVVGGKTAVRDDVWLGTEGGKLLRRG